MRSPVRRSGVVLVAVLVVLTMSALIGTTVLAMTSAQRESARTSLRRTQARALAWSGVQAVMAELSEQREDMLDGRDPYITEEWTVFEYAGGTQGVFRLIPLGDGPLAIVSESAKLNVNHATQEMLEALPMIDANLARNIVDTREQRAFASVEELLSVDGIDADLLYGSGDDGGGFFEPLDEVQSPLVDVLTVFSFDPNIQAGLGPQGHRHRGDLRINLNLPWSERLGRAIERRYDKNVADVVKALKERGTSFENDASLVAVLQEFKVPPEDWAEVFDVFTATSDPYELGRVDLTRASEMVIRCLPGFDDAMAEAVVSARDGLDEETLKSATWIAGEELVTPGVFAGCVDMLTTRSMQWRVRVEAGLLMEDQQISWGGDEGANPADFDFDSLVYVGGDEDELRDRVVVEAVIDVSSARPRVAYMRDLTLLEVGRAIRAELVEASSWEMETDEDLDEELGMTDDETGSGFEPIETIGSGIDRGSPSEPEEAPMGDDPGGGEVRSSAGDRSDEESESTSRAQDVPETGPDRRLGRWTTGQGAGR